MANVPGRTCPLSYRYADGELERAPDLYADTLYVAGGLYGNEQALDRVAALQAAEPESVLVFNGDFNWFNTDGESFQRINQHVLTHVALRGNVETELAADYASAGCGCGYPEWVGDAEVARSNAIMARLRVTAGSVPQLRARLGALPMNLIAEMGGVRIAVVHGDLESLAGWGLAQETASTPEQQAAILRLLRRNGLGVVASSHTCLPLLLELGDAMGEAAVINNGAAGMPNFAGTHFGVVTRISTRCSQGLPVLYGARLGELHIEALALHYDAGAFVRAFLANWPVGSEAYVSYWKRIRHGPEYLPEAVLRRTAAPQCAGI